MEMSWLFGIPRFVTALALLAAALVAQKPPKLEKPRRHGIGLVYAIPKDWKVEDGAEAVLLLPPGVVIDPEKEDNVEVIFAAIVDGLSGPEDAAIPDELKAKYSAEGVTIAREPLKEIFSAPGKPGAIYTLDLRKGSRNFRVRVFYIQVKGKLLSLTASGDTTRLSMREPALRAIAASLGYTP
jgi:hypothetical protein